MFEPHRSTTWAFVKDGTVSTQQWLGRIYRALKNLLMLLLKTVKTLEEAFGHFLTIGRALL